MTKECSFEEFMAATPGAKGATDYANVCAERDRLREVNAELLAALRAIAATAARFDSPDTRYYVKTARAAIAKADGVQS